MSGLTESSARHLARLAAAAAVGHEGRLREAMVCLRDEGRAVEVEEAILQLYLFAGYPRALNALTLWRSVLGGELPEASRDDWSAFEARGEEVCRRVYGRVYRPLRRNIARLHPDLDRWMVVEGYGKVLGRPGLDLKWREMCAVATLAALGARPQLHAHLQGALNTGASREEVDEWVCWLAEELPAERLAVLRELWKDVRARRCL